MENCKNKQFISCQLCAILSKESACNPEDAQEKQVRSLVWKDPWRRKWQPTPVFLPGEFHGQRSLMTYSPWGCKESDTTEQLSAHKQSGVMKSLQSQPVWPRRWIIPLSSLSCLLITSGTVGLSDQLSGYLSAAVSVTLTSLNNGPQSTREVMLAIQICQTEVLSTSFKRNGDVLNKKRKKIVCWGCEDRWEERIFYLWNCEEREIRASFAVTPQTAKVTASVCDTCLVRMEKLQPQCVIHA